MAFGLSPNYIQELPLDNLTHEQFLVLAIEAAKKCGWSIGHVNYSGFVAYTKMSMSSYSEEVKVEISGNAGSFKSTCMGNQLADLGKNKKNINILIQAFNELKDLLSPMELAQKYDELKLNLGSPEDLSNQHVPATKEKLGSVLSIFKPVKGFFITPIIIDLNILIFILMVVSGVSIMLPDSESLIKWGANYTPATLGGEWWRLITCCFLHIGLLHLLFNMYALVYIGLLLEPHLGRARFTAAYFLTGIAASITSLYWHDVTISAGASGAIFGMYGVFLAMLTTNYIEKSARQSLLSSIGVFVVFNLVNGTKGGVDNAAHLGGLISGCIIGYAFIPSLKKPDDAKMKYGTIGLIAIFILASTYFIFSRTPKDTAIYDEKMKSFVSMEAAALDVLNNKDNVPREKLLRDLQSKGIYNWRECIKLLTELDQLNLPDEYHDRIRKILEYSNLRLNGYKLYYKSIAENTEIYDDSIRIYWKEINDVINDIKGK